MIHEWNPCVAFKNNALLFCWVTNGGQEINRMTSEPKVLCVVVSKRVNMKCHKIQNRLCSLRFVLLSICLVLGGFMFFYFFRCLAFFFISCSSAISFAHCLWINGGLLSVFVTHVISQMRIHSLGQCSVNFLLKWHRTKSQIICIEAFGSMLSVICRGPLPSTLPNNNLNEGYLCESKQRWKKGLPFWPHH